MVAGGLLDSTTKYTEAIANMALEIRDKIGARRTPTGEPLGMHIGIGTAQWSPA
jgi:hypothetical protein